MSQLSSAAFWVEQKHIVDKGCYLEGGGGVGFVSCSGCAPAFGAGTVALAVGFVTGAGIEGFAECECNLTGLIGGKEKKKEGWLLGIFASP